MNRAKCDHYSKWKHEHTQSERAGSNADIFNIFIEKYFCTRFFLLTSLWTWSFQWRLRRRRQRRRWTCTKVHLYVLHWQCQHSFNLSFMINAVVVVVVVVIEKDEEEEEGGENYRGNLQSSTHYHKIKYNLSVEWVR